MGAKACLILSILLLSYMLIPAHVTAREMLQEPQTAEELKADIDAGRTTHKALKRGTVASKRKPHTEPCRKRYGCRGPPGHIITPIKPVPAPKGKPYGRPRIPYNPPGHPYRRPCKSRFGCRPPAP